MKMKPKSLGQIAYIALIGKELTDFGEWCHLPKGVKRIYEEAAQAVKRAVLNRRKSEIQDMLEKCLSQNLELIEENRRLKSLLRPRQLSDEEIIKRIKEGK